MGNPILDNFLNTPSQQNSNSLSEMWDQLKRSPNPE